MLASCAERSQPYEKTFYVSILPLKSLVEGIVGDDFRVETLVPAGASPETFEPTPRQMTGLDRSELIFSVGWIDFETSLLGKIADREKVVALHEGIEPIAGSCAHEGHSHAHGIDPHVWTSPRALRKMAENAWRAIHAAYPDSMKYTENYRKLDRRLEALDARTRTKIAGSGVASFLVYHPALTYYARDYGLEQIAIEADGKEPSARYLARIIDRARRSGMRRIFYQSEFPASVVETIARDIGASAVEIDPLGEDVIANIDRITDSIVAP